MTRSLQGYHSPRHRRRWTADATGVETVALDEDVTFVATELGSTVLEPDLEKERQDDDA